MSEREAAELLRKALDQCEAERIALADAMRGTLEDMGVFPDTAAFMVQHVIDKARNKETT